MHYEPHTETIAEGEEIDVPPAARGVKISKSADGYTVHYLTPVDPETAREEIREIVESDGEIEPLADR